MEVRFNRFGDEVEVLILTFVYAGEKVGFARDKRLQGGIGVRGGLSGRCNWRSFGLVF